MGDRSLAIKGNIASFVVLFLGMVGITITEGDSQAFVMVLFALAEGVTIVVSWIGRWRKGDVTPFGKRK